MTEPSQPPSLRILELAVSQFRTFQKRTVIPLQDRTQSEQLVVFHGDNGAGKSNALAALDLFFRALTYWMHARSAHAASDSPAELRCEWEKTYGSQGFTPTRRDWPPGSTAPMVIEVRFEQSPLDAFRVRLSPSGSDVFLTAEMSAGTSLAVVGDGYYVSIAPNEAKSLRNLLETPRGAGSRPLFILDAHRRGSWRTDDSYDKEDNVTLSPLLAERLLALRLSLEPIDRQRWRFFQSLLRRFPTLQDKDISIDRIARASTPELSFEDPGRQILRLTELSSGEQQLVTLCAAIVTSRASIVAIAEPEMSLSATNQRMLRDILEQQVKEGLIDQIILESHVQVFDGPEVVRFRRENNTTKVTREVLHPQAESLEARAKQGGAEKEFVTQEGYTKLPEGMRRELGVERGGMVWFLKDERKRWAAWTTPELDELFGLGQEPSSKD